MFGRQTPNPSLQPPGRQDGVSEFNVSSAGPAAERTRSVAFGESMAHQAAVVANPDPTEEVVGVQQTSCCVVGGGPTGMGLVLLQWQAPAGPEEVHGAPNPLLQQTGPAGRLSGA